MAERLFGADQAANILLLGAAYQLGALPIGAAAMEQAIALNGAAVEMNVQAFRHGRLLVARPDALEAKLATLSAAAVEESSVSPRAAEFIASVGAAPGGALEARLHARVDDLIGYQDEAYARDFVNAVARAAAAERTVAPGEERFRDRRRLRPLQADGLQGRVRGRTTAPRPGDASAD